MPGFQLVETKNLVFLNHVYDLVNRLWGLPMHMPCPSLSNLERKNLTTLHNEEYILSLKLDGTRFFLLMGTMEMDGNSHKYSVFINRSYEVFPVAFKKSHPELFDGTLLDGVLMYEPSGAYRYTVFDGIAVDGYDLKAFPFFQRKEKYEGAVKNLRAPPGLIVKSKLWYPLENASEIWELARVLCDGFILQPLNGQLKSGLQTDVFKWKPVVFQRVDFYISVCVEQVLLECGHDADIINASEIGCYLDDLAPCPLMATFTDSRQVYECLFSRFNAEDNKLFFAVVKQREDKHHADDASVVYSTVRSIYEDINVDELNG